MNIDEQFGLFYSELERGTILLNPAMSYSRICSTLGLEPHELDRYLREQFGRSGSEIVDEYRDCLPLTP